MDESLAIMLIGALVAGVGGRALFNATAKGYHRTLLNTLITQSDRPQMFRFNVWLMVFVTTIGVALIGWGMAIKLHL
jgi:hypothetical protein